MIRLRAFSCRAGSRPLLADISLELEAGQCVALVGANGAGKSTLLRCMSGDLFHEHGLATTGDADYAGVPLRAWDRGELARRRAWLAQAPGDSSPRAVIDLVSLGAFPHGGLRRDQRPLLEDALDTWELQALRARRYETLSGGERQRVHLARTWLQLQLHEPAGERLWLLDEPLNNLDLPHQQLLRRELRRQAEAGALVICSVHDLNFALRLAETGLALRAGRLLHAGPVEALAEPALLRELFGTAFIRLQHPGDARALVLPE